MCMHCIREGELEAAVGHQAGTALLPAACLCTCVGHQRTDKAGPLAWHPLPVMPHDTHYLPTSLEPVWCWKSLPSAAKIQNSVCAVLADNARR